MYNVLFCKNISLEYDKFIVNIIFYIVYVFIIFIYNLILYN